MSAADRYSSGIADLATTMASQGCVWFVGAGFSIPSELPGASDLGLTMLRNAVLGADPLVQRIERYEKIKRALLGNYTGLPGLAVQNTNAGIQDEVDRLAALSREKPGPTRPHWVDKIVHLGRIAEVLYRTAEKGRLGQPEVEMAALMGLDNDGDWEKQPSIAHHLLAMLVMEGLVTQIITLNYDDQIERACAEIQTSIEPVRDRRDYRDCAIELGESKPIVFKIHGCRTRYMEARNAFAHGDTEKAWATLVDRSAALVVTDRQLQHWRDSRWAWAKDLFQDLLRRRPFMFIGFSASDTVLQATLNAVAEEVEGHCGPVFVSPSLSFPFYQFLSQVDPAFNPVDPPRILEAYAEQLLPDIYPQAIASYFSLSIATYGQLVQLRAIARQGHGLVDDTITDSAYKVAVEFLTEAALQVAVDAIRVSKPLDPTRSLVPGQYIPASTVRRLLHDLLPTEVDNRYAPLRKHIEEYRRITQVLALMLAVNYPDEATLTRLALTVDASTENVILDIDDPVGAHELRRVVLVPEKWGQSPTEWLKVWMETYFEDRKREEGTYSMIHSSWLDKPQMEEAVNLMDWQDYRGKFIVEIFTIGSHCRVEKGEPVV